MRSLTKLALAVAVLAACGSMAQAEEVDLTGTWEVHIEAQGQTGMPTFEFKQEGAKLTGRYQGNFGEADVTGTVDGTAVEFSFVIQGESKVVYTGTIEKDGTMKGKADYAGQATGEWTAKRKKAE